jgi:hypothetical protein
VIGWNSRKVNRSIGLWKKRRKKKVLENDEETSPTIEIRSLKEEGTLMFPSMVPSMVPFDHSTLTFDF